MSVLIDLFNTEIPKTLQVRVTPKAAANRLKVELQPDGSRLVRVYVTASAQDGKANKAVLKLLAEDVGLPVSSLDILHGHTSRDKKVAFLKGK